MAILANHYGNIVVRCYCLVYTGDEGVDMKQIEATIFVEPTAKGRARSRIAGKHVITYTPAKTRNAENMIAAMIRQEVMKRGSFDVGMPLKLSATFYIEKPKSTGKKVLMPVKRPDLDNYGKLLLDALNKYAWHDDSQIIDLHLRKRFGSPPRIEIMIREVE